jgi:hypothetical protein
MSVRLLLLNKTYKNIVLFQNKTPNVFLSDHFYVFRATASIIQITLKLPTLMDKICYVSFYLQKSLFQVCQDVGQVFNAYSQTHQPIRDALFQTVFGWHRTMRHAGRVLDQRVHISQ